MSTGEATQRADVVGTPVGARQRGTLARLVRSELWLIYGRRRNWVGAVVLASVPIIIAISVKVTGSQDADSFVFGRITENGLFVALAALTVELPFFLPIAVAMISGDAVAGEANLGTLRYLLVTPVDRTRLLVVKLVGIGVFTASAVLLVAGVGALAGLALFGGGPLVTLSGSELPFVAGLGRLALVCGYLIVCLLALGGIGLLASTLTEQPIAATVAVLGITLVSQILDALPALSATHLYLPTHHWMAFGDLLRDPVDVGGLGPGIASAAAWGAVTTSLAWARFTSADVSS